MGTIQTCSESPRRLLLVKLSSIGDVVHALPVAALLRRRYPDAFLAWAVGPAAADVVTGNPYLDAVLVVGARSEEPGVHALPALRLRHLHALHRLLRGFRFDTALDMQGLFKSALLARLSGARTRIGFRNLQEGTFLLNNRRLVPDRRDVHVVEGYLGFAEALDAPRAPVEFALTVSPEDTRAAAGLLPPGGSTVALIPGARWRSKQWPAGRFAEVADALHHEFGCRSIVLGGTSDAPLAAAIAAAAAIPVRDLTGRTTLKQLAAIFRLCRLTISNDTGPMYISSAVGTPTLAIFGPTDPARLGPYGEGHAKVTAAVPCAPCRRRECHPLRCLDQVTPEQVLAAARTLLARSSADDDSVRARARAGGERNGER